MSENREKIYDGITEIREDLIEEAAEYQPVTEKRTGTHKKSGSRRGKHLWWKVAVAAVLVLCIAVSGPLWSGKEIVTAQARMIAEAEYPEMAPYPKEEDFQDVLYFDWEAYDESYRAWRDSQMAQKNQPEGYADGLESFFSASMQTFLSNAGTENRVYSPLNVYMALAMLAELTEGNSRRQILDVLGTETMEGLRTQAQALWNANYCQDGVTASVLASSLWMREDMAYVEETMDRLKETYYASSYQGVMGSAEYDEMLQDWLNEQTGGLLKEYVSDIRMDPETILALAATVYFKAKWEAEFSEEATSPETFHGAEGDVICDFMHQSGNDGYYWGSKFSAIPQGFENGGKMWFLLPDEGVTVEDLLADPETQSFLLAPQDWKDQKYVMIHRWIPKFDVSSKLELQDGLKELGVIDVFDPLRSDFSPMVKEPVEGGISVTKAEHAARVTIDEEGCTAVAYTVMMEAGGAMPPQEEVDFILDRPFLFAITGATGQLLFVGVVNQP